MIAAWGGAHDTEPFCHYLLARLLAAATQNQLQSIQGFHFGAFERRQGHRVPVFWFLRNAESGPGGRYRQLPQWEFRLDEQLLGRDYAAIPPDQICDQLVTFEKVERIPVWYRNGDLGAFTFTADLLELSAKLLTDHTPGYSIPRALSRWETLAKTLVAASSGIAQVYYRQGVPTIGGRVHTIHLPWDS